MTIPELLARDIAEHVWREHQREQGAQFRADMAALEMTADVPRALAKRMGGEDE